MAEKKERVDCFKCRHFYITWDPNYPKGCKALGFKSRQLPSVDVYANSGMKCQLYSRKETPVLP